MRAAQNRQVRRLLLSTDHICELSFHKLLSVKRQDKLSSFFSSALVVVFPRTPSYLLPALCLNSPKTRKKPHSFDQCQCHGLLTAMQIFLGKARENDGSIQQQSWVVKLFPKKIFVLGRSGKRRRKRNDPPKALVQWQG